MHQLAASGPRHHARSTLRGRAGAAAGAPSTGSRSAGCSAPMSGLPPQARRGGQRSRGPAAPRHARPSQLHAGPGVRLYATMGDAAVTVAAAVPGEAPPSSSSAAAAPDGSQQQQPTDPAVQAEQQRAWEQEMEETLKLVHLLPEKVRAALEAHDRLYELLEVVMDLGRPPLARFPSGDVKLSEDPVTAEDLAQAVDKVGDFGGDNRAGIDATLHRISAMRNRAGRVVGLTCRVGRAITGSAELVRDLIVSGASILFLGRPGVGKTTAIRELSRLCADELGKRVVIVDTSNEIGGDGDVPHAGIGRARRMQVPDPEQQHRVMIEAVENHTPQVVVIDEIGTEAECSAARTIAQRGVQLIATAHGNELENVVKNPALADLVGGIQSVTLGDDEAKRRGVQKSIQERAAPATFNVAVEMLERNRWHVHPDVGAAVDAMLAGQHPGGQARERAPDGSILRYNYNPAIPGGRNGKSGSGGSAAGSGGGAPRSALPELPRAGSAGAGGGAGAAASSGVSMSAAATAAGLGGPMGSGGSMSMDSFDDVASGTGFVRRALFNTSRDEGPVSSSMVTRRGRHVRLGTASPAEALLRLYCADLDEERIWEVMTAMALHDKVFMCPRPEGADAVLTLRSRVKANTALRAAAKAAGVPVYAIKSTSTSNLIKAFRTLLGVEPSAGGFFSARSGSGDVGAAFGSMDSVGSAGGMGGDFEEGDEDDGGDGFGGADAAEIAAAAEASMLGAAWPGGAAASTGLNARPPPSSSYKSAEEREGLEEAQLAVEQIVLPLRQPVELLPRSDAVREAQAGMVARYKLQHELVGEGPDARLRILPAAAPAAAAATTTTANGGGPTDA